MRYRKVAASSAILAFGLAVTSAGNAQEVSVPSVTVANPGGYANPLKLDTDRYDREQRANSRNRGRTSQTDSVGCSADALPAAQRRRMEAEYVERAEADGRASADAWVREQGMRFRQQLIARGVC